MFWSSWMLRGRYLNNYATDWIKTKLIRKIRSKLYGKSIVKNLSRQFVSENYQPKIDSRYIGVYIFGSLTPLREFFFKYLASRRYRVCWYIYIFFWIRFLYFLYFWNFLSISVSYFFFLYNVSPHGRSGQTNQSNRCLINSVSQSIEVPLAFLDRPFLEWYLTYSQMHSF